MVTNVAASSRVRHRAEIVTAKQRVRGFNAIFATESIDAAKAYYAAFKWNQKDLSEASRLKIGIIYSYGANEEVGDGILDDEGMDTAGLNADSRTFLAGAIADYNKMFGTSYDTGSDQFQNYYKDLSQRLKNRELDMVIVVNMFLTGFDATTLNTLFVDKNLRSHGLIQAYSRTNRILNSVKTYGNIVAFRDLEKATNEALELFGNKDAKGVVLLKPYLEYFNQYAEKAREFTTRFAPGDEPVGEKAEKQFIAAFGQILRLTNILTSFDEFTGNQVINDRQMQDYSGIYGALYDKYRRGKEADKTLVNDDVVFEIELVKQVEVNVDYILMLVEKYREHHGDGDDVEIKAEISRAVSASPTLRDKRDLIESFVESVTVETNVDEAWQAFIAQKRTEELAALVAEENLNPGETVKFMDSAFRNGEVRAIGTAINKVLPPVSRFNKDSHRTERKHRVVAKLEDFFQRFYGLASGADNNAD